VLPASVRDLITRVFDRALIPKQSAGRRLSLLLSLYKHRRQTDKRRALKCPVWTCFAPRNVLIVDIFDLRKEFHVRGRPKRLEPFRCGGSCDETLTIRGEARFRVTLTLDNDHVKKTSLGGGGIFRSVEK